LGLTFIFIARQYGRNNAIAHPGVVLSFFYWMYTVIPATTLILGELQNPLFNFATYSDTEIISHLGRSFAFHFFFALTLVGLSGWISPSAVKTRGEPVRVWESKKNLLSDLMVAGTILAIVFLGMAILSAPVETYYDFHTRFDHLSPSLRTAASVLKRLAWGTTPIFLFLCAAYFRNRTAAFSCVIAILYLLSLWQSDGSRVDSILVLIQALCAWVLIKVDSVKIRFVIYLVPIFFLMILFQKYIEVIRLGQEFSSASISGQVSGLFPGEFFALFFPSIDLYRYAGLRDSFGLSLYMKDFLAIVPFYDAQNVDLMQWYWRNFVPTAPVPPYTMGVLSEPAIMGNYWLALQGVVIGVCANLLYRLRLSDRQINTAAYVYASSVSFLVLKYNMLSYVDLIINNFIPSAIVFRLMSSFVHRGGGTKQVL
jgi:hypothetical protein